MGGPLAPDAADRTGERRFWSMVRAAILAYQDRFPELAGRFKIFDLLANALDEVAGP